MYKKSLYVLCGLTVGVVGSLIGMQDEKDISQRDEEGRTALIRAVPTIRTGGFVIDDEDNNEAISNAEQEAHLESKRVKTEVAILHALLCCKTLINGVDGRGRNALFYALLQYSKPLHIEQEVRADYITRVIIPLIEAGENPCLPDAQGIQPIHCVDGTHDVHGSGGGFHDQELMQLLLSRST